MLIATFGPSTGWSGKKITREGDAFVLEDHGPITAADVMEYDRQGQLQWATEGTRGWVGSQIQTVAAPHAASSPRAQTDESLPSQTGRSAPPEASPAAAQSFPALADMIATFQSDSIWSGKRILNVKGTLILDGFGPIAPQAVLEFDRLGHLEWATGRHREWMQLMAVATPPSVVTRDVWGAYSIFWQVLAALAVTAQNADPRTSLRFRWRATGCQRRLGFDRAPTLVHD